MTTSISRACRIQCEREPHLDLLIVNVVSRRHDADDSRWDTINRNHPAKDRFVATECALPDLARERADVLGARQRVGPGELTAADGRNSENRHQFRGNHRGDDAARLVLLPRFTAPDRYAPTS